MTKKTFRGWMFAIAGVSLLIRLLVPMFPLVGTVFDDELMVWMARNILDGKWIGSYSISGHLILSKPPGYPLFLAYTHWIPISSVNLIHLLILIAAGILIRELRIMSVSRSRCLGYFAFIAFYPSWFNEEMSRIYRDGFLAMISFWFLVIAIILRRQLCASFDGKNWQARIHVILSSLLCGLVAGLFIITKPSWHMLAVFLFVLLLSALFPLKQNIFRKLLASAIVGSLIFFGTMAAVLPVVYKNKATYGVAVTDTYAQGSFPRAMKAIASLPDNINRPYVDITRQMRYEGYRVSPEFKKLEKYLEQPDNTGWRGVACGHKQLGKICDESAAWFPWDYRAAIQSAGLGNTAKEFEKTNKQIASEIETACSSKELKCDRSGIAPGLDSIDSLDSMLVLDAVFAGLAHLSSAEFGLRSRYSQSTNYPGASDLWPHTIRGLPKLEYVSNYEANNVALSHFRAVLANAYQIFLSIGLIASLVGLFVRARNKLDVSINNNLFRLIGIASWFAMMTIIVQLSLLEASSGLYMTEGGSWYLLCAAPFMLISIIVGYERLFTIYRSRFKLFVNSIRN